MSQLLRFLSVALILLTVSACSGDEAADTPAGDRPWMRGGGGGGASSRAELEEISVKAYRVDRQSIARYLLSNTTLEPIREVVVIARVGALVTDILVEEGDQVREGQLLARLDDREIRNEHEQANIAVGQAEIRARQAEVQAEQSQANLERSERLRSQKLISQQDYDQASLTARTDQLAYEVAQQEFEAAKARLQAAELQLEYTTIESSISGVITERMIDVGDRVSANQEVFRVEDFTPMWARVFIPERDLKRVRMGQRALIEIEAFPERSFNAAVKMINPRIDAESGTVKVTLEVADSGGLLRPGMFGVVKIPTETRQGVLVVPKKAIVREREENRIFVIQEDGTVSKRSVELGLTEEDRVEILSGVSEGDAVVTVGQESLNDGYPVKILAWETPQGEQMVELPGISGNRAIAAPADGSGGRRGGGATGQGGGDERFQAFLERFPEIKTEYEKRLKDDPELANDAQKRRAFVREMMSKLRDRR
ncbi:MAG TPA: efflux RND transporter periplasmic adaptor subunit [Acidobacteriota bacterium]|nr:efflux RND transporter periplasmic adaptor subunit [Acidobacteriota bacterium]